MAGVGHVQDVLRRHFNILVIKKLVMEIELQNILVNTC